MGVQRRSFVIESLRVARFFRAVICNHRDKYDLKFTEGYVFFTRDVVSMDDFRNLGSSEASCSRWGIFPGLACGMNEV